jgi:DNA-binding beta-propeller fold protein YncE
MLKKTCCLLVLCAAGTFTLFVLPDVSHFGLVHGESRQHQRANRRSPATTEETKKTVHIERAPERTIEDPHSSFSAVAVDDARNEIILSDENLGQILVYGRLDNTPAQAALTEPKRIIGGSRTKINLNCGTYVDPFSGDIYSVNGDTENWMTVFSPEQRGNVPAERTLAAPHRAFGVAVDEQAKELFLSIEHPPAVVVYPKLAQGNDAPLRILEGDKTQLADVHGMALDTKNQLLYVVNQGATTRSVDNDYWSRNVKPGASTVEWTPSGDQWEYTIAGSGEFVPPSISVYPLKASGNTPPLRVIQGPRTMLDWPTHISLDVERGELFVANTVTDSILVFHTTDNGNVAPFRILKGPHTGLKTPHGVFADTKNNELVVANFGNHSSTIYRLDASGDTPPLRTIRAAFPNTPAPMFGNIAALAYDTKRDQLLVPN